MAFLALVAIFVFNIFGLYFGWYFQYFWFDTTLHFLGGFFMAMLMANYLSEYFISKKALKNILIIVGATMLIGVVWEFAEYIANQILIEPFYKYFGVRAYFMGDLDDTVNDLMMDVLGGLAYALIFIFPSRTKLIR